ncbi:phage tail protein [Streptomyces sp. NPDC001658]
MADDINLPNLVSHLAVNLDGIGGAISDAARQGSSMGAALGEGVQRELRGALTHLPEIQLDGNSTDLDRDFARIRGELEELSNQRIGIDIPVDEALRNLERLEPHLERLARSHPQVDVQVGANSALRQLATLRAAARQVDDTDVTIDVDTDRPNQLAGILGRVRSMARSAAGALGGVGKAAAAIGTAVPLLAGVVQTLANVAPAAGVAVTGMAAVSLASGAVKLAAVGMEDALAAALDPSKAAEFSEALDKLSPSAQRFATVVRDLSPALREVQQAVQEEVFRGLGDNLQRTATSVLPVLRTNLLGTATALGDMAAGVLGAGKELADNGTLGQALGSASKGLQNLAGVPGVVVTALGQIAAAAGPSFEKLTSGAAGVATRIGERLGAAFESGAMQDAIEQAIDLLRQLMDIGGNVFDIIGSIFSAVPEGGGGTIAVLQDVTAAIADVMNTADVQGGLRSLFETMGTIGSTVAPLLAQALLAVAPVVSALGPPIQLLVTTLGGALSPIIEALGPVLQALAVALGQLIVAVSPLLAVFGQLITALLPVVLPLFQALGEVFAQIAPVLQELANALLGALAPILAQMPTYVQPFADILVMLAQTILPVVANLFVQLAPSLATLGEAFGQLIVAVAPIMEAFGRLVALLLEALMPIIQPLIGLIASLAEILASLLAGTITNIVVPVLEFVAKLLTGDFSGAWNMAKEGVGSAASWIGEKATQIGQWIGQGVGTAVSWLKGLPGRALSALAGLTASMVGPAVKAGAQLVSAIQQKISDAVAWVKGLPGRATAALGNLSGTLRGVGRQLIQGFIDGIAGMFGSVKSKLGELTGNLTDWKGPPKKDAKILTPAGRLLIEGFIKGIDGTTAKLRSRLESITKALPDNVRSGYGKTLKRATAELEKLVTKRDSVIKKLASGQKKLDDLVKARSKASADIREGILDEANITTGRADVNSVSAITVGLQQALKETKAFEANTEKLKKAGLRSDLLQQIADAGVAAGGATAAALAKATPAELKRINDLQSQLAKSATSTGNTVGDALYLAGINAAKGLVAGLKSQEKAIEAQMTRIAKGMITTTKKVHRAKSPARAFFDIGVMDGEGLRGGLLATAGRVRDAARSMAGAALDVASGVGGALAVTPTAGQLSAVYAGSSGGDQINNITLNGTRATPAEMVHELTWLGLVGRR